MKQIIEMSDVEELKNMLEGALDKARFDAILARYVDMVPWLVIDLPSGYPIYRGREMIGDDLLYLEKRELSYPPAEYAPMGRVSYAHHPMFYGSVLPGDKDGGLLPWITIALELDVFQGKEGRRDLTFGIWEKWRPLRLAALPFSNGYEEKVADEIANIQREWEEKVKPHMTEAEIEMATFFSDLLALPGSEKLYQFTAGFFEFFLNHSEEGKELDGVAYLSVPSKGMGLNICLKSEIADMLRLKSAAYVVFYKTGEELSRIVYLEADVNTKPLKWFVNVHNGGDRLPEPLRSRFMKDAARLREDVKAAGYNRGRTKLVKRKMNIK